MQTMIVALTVSLSTVGCCHKSCGGHASRAACYGGYSSGYGGYSSGYGGGGYYGGGYGGGGYGGGGHYASGYGYGSGGYGQGYSTGRSRPMGFGSRFFGNARSAQMVNYQPVQGYAAPGYGYGSSYGNMATTYGYGTPNQAYSAPMYTSPTYTTPGTTTYSSSYGAPVSGTYPAGTYTTPTTGNPSSTSPWYTSPPTQPTQSMGPGVRGLNQAPASSATGVNSNVTTPGTVSPSASTISPAPPAPTIPGRNP